MLWMLTFAHAATWTVSPAPASAAWVGDAVINGSCRTAGGVCTLRAAIDEANAAGCPQTIQPPAGDFPLPVTISLPTLTGAGMGSMRVSQTGGTLLRAVDPTLGDLTISGAAASTTDPVITGSGGPGWHATIRLDPMLSSLLTLPNGRTAVGPLRGSPLINAGTRRGGLDLGGQSRAMDGDGVAIPDIAAVGRPRP